MKKICVLGSIGYDLVTYLYNFPKAGETILGKKFIQNPGGKGENQAIAAAKAGGNVTFVGSIGDDNYGEILKKTLENNKVKSVLKVVPNTSTQIATILIEENGENHIVIVPGANNCFDKKMIDDNIKLIKESDIIILQLEIPMETVEYAVDKAYELKKIIILNPAPGAKLSQNIIKKCTYLTPNENEAGLITQMPYDTIDNIKAAAKKLYDQGAQNVIITLGEKGAYLKNKNDDIIIPTYKVNAVDTTGAGDCFTGVFATYLSKGKNMIEAIKYANIASSISVTRPGAVPSLPSEKEIEEKRKTIKNF
jgi:ribokinase